MKLKTWFGVLTLILVLISTFGTLALAQQGNDYTGGFGWGFGMLTFLSGFGLLIAERWE